MTFFKLNIFPRTILRLWKDVFLLFLDNIISPHNSFQIINRYAIKRVIEYYGGGKAIEEGHQIDKKKGNLGYGFIHYALIRNLKPKRVLCIGSTMGFIPVICALACKDNQVGKVDFVDAGYGKEHPKNWGGIGFWGKINHKKHFDFFGLGDLINVYVMTSQDFAKKYPQRSYQYIYIDGDHSYEGVKLDYNLFWSKLEKNGFIAFHDVTVKNWKELKNFGVWKLWNEIKSEKKIVFSLKQSGLGIIQK